MQQLIEHLRIVAFLCYTCNLASQTDQRRWHTEQWKYVDKDSCPKDCSQTTPRFSGDQELFNCTVGNKKELDQFRRNYKYMLENAQIRFDAPRLIEIGLHRKNSTRALNITFQLPKGKHDGFQETEYVRAVFLHFQSVEEIKYRDVFYYNNPRERLFEFHNFKPSSTYDIVYPRIINYDCLVGLDEPLKTAVYKITLESAPGYNITYHCTVPGLAIQEENWLPVIATYFNESQRSVLVVFEELIQENNEEFRWNYPVNDKEVYYNVSLFQNGLVYQSKTMKSDGHIVIFENLAHGRYNIMVSRCEKWLSLKTIPQCISATSYIIDARAIPPEEPQTDLHSLYLVLSVSIGCLVGLLVIVFATFVYLTSRRKNSRQNIPLHEERKEEEHNLTELLKKNEENNNTPLSISDGHAETELKEPLEEIEAKTKMLISVTTVLATSADTKTAVTNEIADALLRFNESTSSIDELSVCGDKAKDCDLDMPSNPRLEKDVSNGRPKDINVHAHLNDINPARAYHCPRHNVEWDHNSKFYMEHDGRDNTEDLYFLNEPNDFRTDLDGHVICTTAEVHRCIQGHHYHSH